MGIRIFYDETSFRLKGWRHAVKLIEKVIRKENQISGDLNFIITDDKTIRKLNFEFLEHDYTTDVITFGYNSGNIVNGEVYISIETVKKNAINYNVSLDEEVFRVFIHGVLHLLGYDDKSRKQKREVKKMEDSWLALLKEQKGGF